MPSGWPASQMACQTAGPQSAAILTNDLTAAYVHENSAYST